MKSRLIDEIRDKWNSSNKTAFILEVLLIIFTLWLCISNVYSPRIHKVFVLLGLLYYDVKVYRNLNDEKAYKFLLETPLCLGFILYCTFFLSSMFPTHMPWEYEKDIMELKELQGERLEHFPDELPESAQDVRWKVFDGFLQGTPYEILHLRADEEYIDDVISLYEDKATVMHYNYESEMWDVSFMGMNLIEEGTEQNVTVYILNQTGEHVHMRVWGFYTYENDNIICFFGE